MGLAIAILLSFSRIAIAADDDVKAGQRYFLTYCASCHGVNADGRGPVASALSRPPANLRLLGEKYGMPLPARRIAAFIDGREEIRAHGNPDMPVWGQRFYQMGEGQKGEEGISEVIRKIVDFLQTIQDRRTASIAR